jgi:multicomponent K+:H+ antiporter subunit A
VLLALESLSRFAWQPGANTDHAMDINPARDDVAKTENEG